MQAKLWRCRICSKAYISSENPCVCPFCGAHSKWIVPAEKWKPEPNIKLSEKSRKNVEAALVLEKSNTSFYLCVSRTSTDPFIKGMFTALARVESEHVGVFSSVLGSSGKECPEQPCTTEDRKSVSESLEREIKAVATYGKFLGETKEKRLRDIFSALVEIEGDHIRIDREVLKMRGWQ
ncbi:MAG: ferritin family protein [Candidatus Aenigmatarchaeota archaeon]